jgi:hypothetical protein
MSAGNTNKEHDHDHVIGSIVQLTEGSLDERGDALSMLMQKEARVLDTVDRVVNTARSSVVDARLFTHLTLADVARNSMRTLRDIMFDITHIGRLTDIPGIFAKQDRKIYVGLFIISIAFFMFFVSASTA